MLPSDSLAELGDILKKKSTHCFKVDPGEIGWCVTCK